MAQLRNGHTSRWDWRRAGDAGISLLYMGVTIALGPADAILDAASLSSPTHVESPQEANCASQHGHFLCQVVRSLSLAGPSRIPSAADLPAPVVRYLEMGHESGEMKRAPILLGSVIPRGPPVA